MPNILVCSDSFKGSLSSKEIGDIFATVAKEYDGVNITSIPIADGGEGTLDAIYSSGEYIYKEIQCSNPLFQKITAKYLVNEDTAIIEMAQASGLTLIPYKDGNAGYTSSYGTGELILDAIKGGSKNIYITVGGSATNDGGIGALSALGYEFLDKDNIILKPIGFNLDKIAYINTENAIDTKGIKFTIIEDVDNPLVGERGATFFYGKQKGAVGDFALSLENGMINYANVIEKQLGVHLHDKSGAGAAGGIAAGLMAFLNAEIKSGINTVLDIVHFNENLKNIDAIVTGEGCIDRQSIHGKAISGVINRAKQFNIPVYIIAGGSKLDFDELKDIGISGIVLLSSIAKSVEDSMQNAYKYALDAANVLIALILEGIK